MGLLTLVADFFLMEHHHRPITGDVLFVGRQTTFLDDSKLHRMLRKHA